MPTERRRKLLRIMARIEQLIAEAEDILVGETDDEILLRTSKLLAEQKRMLADMEQKFREDDQAR
jgi:hypothetical protein